MTLSAGSFRIRPAAANDAPAIAALVEQLGYHSTVSEIEERIARLGAAPNDLLLVAESAGVGVVGVLALNYRLSLHRQRDIATITSLVVDERRRGAGVGARLVRAAEREARERGCGQVQVDTHNRRDDAHRFYERIGFEHTGRRYVRKVD